MKSLTMEEIGNRVDAARRKLSTTKLDAQMALSAAQQAATREEQALHEYALLQEDLQKNTAENNEFAARFGGYVSGDARNEAARSLASALRYRPGNIGDMAAVVVLEWANAHKDEMIAIVRDQTIGASERLLARWHEKYPDIAKKNEL
jgi:hypothetical protein